MKSDKNRVEIASDVFNRDGIGIEVYQENELVMEIFRNDTQKTRTVTFYKNDVPLDFIEECIATFKKDIPWNFIDYSEFEKGEKNYPQHPPNLTLVTVHTDVTRAAIRNSAVQDTEHYDYVQATINLLRTFI